MKKMPEKGKIYQIRFLGDKDPDFRAYSGVGIYTGIVDYIGGLCGEFVLPDGSSAFFPIEDVFEDQ